MGNKQISLESKDCKSKHRWYDVIVAWASGEEIQYRLPGGYDWKTYNRHTYVSTGYESSQPDFSDSDYEWRIKPKTITNKYRMALVNSFGDITTKEPYVKAIDITDSCLDFPAEYDIQGFIRWVGDAVEVEMEG